MAMRATALAALAVRVCADDVTHVTPSAAPSADHENANAMLEVVVVLVIVVLVGGCLICMGGCFCSQFADKYCENLSRRLEARISGQEQEPRPAGGNVLIVAEAGSRRPPPKSSAAGSQLKGPTAVGGGPAAVGASTGVWRSAQKHGVGV